MASSIRFEGFKPAYLAAIVYCRGHIVAADDYGTVMIREDVKAVHQCLFCMEAVHVAYGFFRAIHLPPGPVGDDYFDRFIEFLVIHGRHMNRFGHVQKELEGDYDDFLSVFTIMDDALRASEILARDL